MKIKNPPTKRKTKRHYFDPEDKPVKAYQRLPQLNKFFNRMSLKPVAQNDWENE